MSAALSNIEALAQKLPASVKANALELVKRMGEEIEGIGDEPIKWRPENLKVVQATSDRSKLPRGAAIGAIIIGENVAKQPQKVIPLRAWDSRQYWSPDKDEARLLCSSPDAVVGYIGKECKNCEFGKFDSEAGRSACNKGKTVLSISDDLSTIFVTNFTKTNYANGKDWAGLMRKAGVAPYRRIYEMKTETSKKYKNVEALLVETQNESTPKEHIDFLEALFAKVGADREEHLAAFREMLSNRKQDHVLLAASAGGGHTDVPQLTTDVAQETVEQTGMAKKYTM